MMSSNVNNTSNQVSYAINQQIKPKEYPCRIIAFELKPQDIKFTNQITKRSNKARIVKCDFTTNYYNISPNNNCIRWLRKVKLELNPYVKTKFPTVTEPVNPYIDNAKIDNEWHLCTLYIKPGQYASVNDIVKEINKNIIESVKDLFKLKITTSGTGNTFDAEENAELLYDKYYYTLVTAIANGTDIVTIVTNDSNSTIGLNFVFDMLPVTSDTVLSTTDDFINVFEQPNLIENYTTKILPHIIKCNQHNFYITNDDFLKYMYLLDLKSIDSYYYNFTIDDDILIKLGFELPKIIYNSKYMVNYEGIYDEVDESLRRFENNPIYSIKGVYYSEIIYTGPVLTSHKYAINTSRDISINQKNMPIYDKYNININDNIMNYISNDAIYNYFIKQTHYANNTINLSIPMDIDVRITQNSDIEQIINVESLTNPINIIAKYNTIGTNNSVYNSSQQYIDINNTINIPDSGIYVYLTSANQRYPIIKSDATLHVVYLG